MAHRTDGLRKPSINILPKRGKVEFFSKTWGQYGIKAAGGKVYEYKFDIGYVRDPIKRQCRKRLGICASRQKRIRTLQKPGVRQNILSSVKQPLFSTNWQK